MGHDWGGAGVEEEEDVGGSGGAVVGRGEKGGE